MIGNATLRILSLSCFIFLAIVSIGLRAYAEEITVDFEVRIDYVGLPFTSAMEVPRSISGSYTFESVAQDQVSSANVGIFPIKTLTFASEAIYGSSDGTDVRSGIAIFDSSSMDIFEVQAYGDVVGSSIDGYEPLGIRIILVFPPTEFSSEVLPSSAPNLRKANTAEFELIFKRGTSFASIHGTITELGTR
jgi:hypothetical protein